MTAGRHDIVVFGATGFTGRKVAAYLAAHAPPGLRWAVAGRSRAKLERMQRELLPLARGQSIDAIEASIDDPGSLARMAGAARVLLTTVGPFIEYGERVARACVEQGTDYVDSTGEPHFVQLLRGRYAEPAAKGGVRLVPCCGFDSIPADLGALFTVSQLPSDQPIVLSGYVSLRGVFSGGTERSAILSLAPPKEAVAVADPAPGPGRRVRLAKPRVERRPDLGGWSAPLPTIDASIVLRSAASLPRFGPDFSYAHHVIHPSLAGLIGAFWVFGGLALFARFAPIRALLLKLIKKSGEGPTEEQMSRSWFKVHFVAECAGIALHTEVSGGDPGYGETSKMLAESALCLAQDRERLPARAGVLTPAEAMGEVLIERLRRAGLRFQVL